MLLMVACSSPVLERSDELATRPDSTLVAAQEPPASKPQGSGHASPVDSLSGADQRTTIVRLPEVILERGLNLVLDSLIAFEKGCLGEDSPDYWQLGQLEAQLFMFTGTSGVGESAIGFTKVNDDVVFIYKALPHAADQSDKIRSFSRTTFAGAPAPEDYSTWLIHDEYGREKIVKSFTVPCN
jgi:hypothetical protein